MSSIGYGICFQLKSTRMTKGIGSQQVSESGRWIEVDIDDGIGSIVAKRPQMTIPIVPNPCREAVANQLNRIAIIDQQVVNGLAWIKWTISSNGP